MKVNFFILTFVAAFSAALTVDANAARSITLYLDGAQIEQRESAKKGYLELYLPPDARMDSLRIAPANGAEILRVITAPLKPAKSMEKELAQLVEREDILHDRLKALTVREDIFKSAAKSQSAKAPRRTKSNPEPLSTIKQGTDYAITQLEAVYHAKRKAEKELAQITERRYRLGKDGQSGGTVAKVWIAPAGGSVTATWIQPDRSWSPLYQVKVADKERVILSLMSPGITLSKGETAELALALLQSAGKPLKFKYEGEWALLKKEEFTVASLRESNSSPLTITFTNSSTLNLPSGDIFCFNAGVYIGKGQFPGAETGKTVEFYCNGR